MEIYERELFLSRIKSGVIRVHYEGRRYTVTSPTIEIDYNACEIYLDIYNECRNEGIMDDDELLDTLIRYGIWTEKMEMELNDILPKHIEYWKVGLFNSYLKSNTKEKNRKHLEVAKAEEHRLYSIRHMFDHMTCAGIANFCKTQYIIKKCTKNANWSVMDINKFMNQFYKVLLSSSQIRELSRTAPWNNEWSIRKKNGRIFEQQELSPEQKILIMWSSMYDSIYESPECPSDDIINDDDCLDGWLIIQRRKREADKNQSMVSNQISNNPKINNSDEIFIVAETKEDAEKINALNNPFAKRTIADRLSQIKNQGAVKHHNLSDIKRDKQIKATNQAVNQIRNT